MIMSRSRIDWDKGNRDEKAHLTAQAFATEGHEQLPSEISQTAKIKDLLCQLVRQYKPDDRQLRCVSDSQYVRNKLIRESRITILGLEHLNDEECQCECEMRIEYAFGSKHLDVLDLLACALGARRPENSYNFLFWFKCPKSIFV
ncbi:MAG: hypothetical protein QOD03_1657 [Verrucomicrobiota bacterium]|jgi:hypothetical protein